MEKTLRETLVSAINSRETTLRNGTCRRRDTGRVLASVGLARAFLASYPVADDQRVRQWCMLHVDDLCRIVPGNQPRVLAKLITDTLAERNTRPVTPSGDLSGTCVRRDGESPTGSTPGGRKGYRQSTVSADMLAGTPSAITSNEL